MCWRLSKFALRLAALAALLASPLAAADIAHLANGQQLEFARLEARGSILRLHFPGGGFADVPASSIVFLELAPAEPAPAAPSTDLSELPRWIEEAAADNQLEAELIWSVIAAESNFDPRAVSRKGAQGLMQLMPATAAELGVADPFDPAANVAAGSRYLRQMLDEHGDNLKLALAAYNSGPERMARHSGVPPIAETREFIKRVLKELERRRESDKARVRLRAPNREEARR